MNSMHVLIHILHTVFISEFDCQWIDASKHEFIYSATFVSEKSSINYRFLWISDLNMLYWKMHHALRNHETATETTWVRIKHSTEPNTKVNFTI